MTVCPKIEVRFSIHESLEDLWTFVHLIADCVITLLNWIFNKVSSSCPMMSYNKWITYINCLLVLSRAQSIALIVIKMKENIPAKLISSDWDFHSPFILTGTKVISSLSFSESCQERRISSNFEVKISLELCNLMLNQF